MFPVKKLKVILKVVYTNAYQIILDSTSSAVLWDPLNCEHMS